MLIHVNIPSAENPEYCRIFEGPLLAAYTPGERNTWVLPPQPQATLDGLDQIRRQVEAENVDEDLLNFVKLCILHFELDGERVSYPLNKFLTVDVFTPCLDMNEIPQAARTAAGEDLASFLRLRAAKARRGKKRK